MENNQKIEMLKEYVDLKREVERKSMEIKKLEVQKEQIKSGLSSGPRGGEQLDKTQKLIEEIDQLQRELLEDKTDLIRHRRRIRNSIKSIKKSQWRQAMELHFMEGQRFGDIALEMNYSEIQIKRFVAEGIKSMK